MLLEELPLAFVLLPQAWPELQVFHLPLVFVLLG
jgi:hypothetical protein